MLPFAVRHIHNHISQHTTAEMDWCRVVEKQEFPTNSLLAPCKGRGGVLCQVEAGQCRGRGAGAGQGRRRRRRRRGRGRGRGRGRVHVPK